MKIKYKKIILFFLFTLLSYSLNSTVPIKASCDIVSDSKEAFLVLSAYQQNVQIGDQFYLYAFTYVNEKPTFKSSNQRIASVDELGLVTAKKAGKATITVKLKNASAACKITVEKTKISLDSNSIRLECNETYQLLPSTSNNSMVTYHSKKPSVATIDENGLITAIKPGSTTITLKADQTNLNVRVIVKKPTLTLNRKQASIYRNSTARLFCEVSSHKTPSYKSSKPSIATVDENGVITGKKHGTTTITASVDGVRVSCKVIVMKPEIELSDTEITLNKGDTYLLTADVSSGNTPTWSVSNSKIIKVQDGKVQALSKGTAYVYVTEDGTKVRCKVKVLEVS